MDFDLTDDRRMLADTLDRFLKDNYPIEKRHEHAASDEGFSREAWGQFAELGVIGALFSEEEGGFAGAGGDLSVVFEALGRALVVEPFIPTVLGGTVLGQLGSDEQKAHLEAIIGGESMIALAHGE